jgi:hypothetical protein
VARAASRVEIDDAIASRPARSVRRVAPGRSIHQHRHHAVHEPLRAAGGDPRRHFETCGVAGGLDRVGYLIRHLRRWRARPPRVAEREHVVIGDLLDHVERRREILVGLPGETDDEVGRERDVGDRLLELGDQLEVTGACVSAIHALEHPIGSRLQRQVQVLAYLGHVADGADQARRQVVGIRRREADARESLDGVDALQQVGQVDRRRQIPPIGIDRLAEQRHLATSGFDQPADFGDDGLGRVAAFAAARGRHHAERAVLLAALHDGDEGAQRARRRRARRQLDERSLAGVLHGPLAGPHAVHHLTDAGDGR